MRTTWKMSLALMSMLVFAGLTGCEQAEKAVGDVTESAKQTVETAKAKAVDMLGGTEKNETNGQNQSKKRKRTMVKVKKENKALFSQDYWCGGLGLVACQ